MKKLLPTESQIQSTVCDYLAIKKHFFWRSNNLPVFDKSGGFFRALPKYAIKGLADITIIKKGGLVCFLEIKRSGGKLSPSQEIFRDRCKELGAEYYVITDLDQVIEMGL